MKWQKASDESRALIESAMEGVDAVKRPMFGYPAYFINDNMFTGLFQDSFFIRLPSEQSAALASKYGPLSPLEPMPGRPMKDYLVLPEALVGDSKRLKVVIREAAEAARTLPPKQKKKPKKAQGSRGP